MSEFYGEDFYELQEQCDSQSIGDIEREITRLSFKKSDLKGKKNQIQTQIKSIDNDLDKIQSEINKLLISLKTNFSK
jgi:chromosome segregation ATPase